MKLGMTGTQRGMTAAQCIRFEELVKALQPAEFHHGDCIGADAEAHYEVSEMTDWLGVTRHCHPPTNPSKRAFTSNDVTYPAKPYLDRNKDIVDATDVLVVLPGEREEQLRSGTPWSTYRYAKQCGKVRYIIYP